MIEKNIVLAQVASDAGKRKYLLAEELRDNSAVRKAVRNAYHAKDIYILEAIEEIRMAKPHGTYFYVCKDVEKRANYIVYFDFRVDNKRYQVSFHSFNKKLEKYTHEKGTKTSWDERSSRDACLVLAKAIGLAK